MAQKLVLVDDIDGTEATETITFGIDGQQWDIDLNEEHATAIRETLNEWIANARKHVYTPQPRHTTRRQNRPANPETASIRAWAVENGYEISERGRIPANIITAYREANGQQA